MTWYYCGDPVPDFAALKDPTLHGFVYRITYSNGKQYIGKKDFFSTKRLPALKSGKVRPNAERTYRNSNGKRVYYDILRTESNWLTYNSSSKLVKGLTPIRKEILALAHSKRELTYLETKYLFIHEVLESDNYLNENILGKFFKIKPT